MLEFKFRKSIIKAFTICVIQAFIGGTLNYFFQIIGTNRTLYPFDFKSIFFESLIFCSIVYFVYYLFFKYFDKNRKLNLFTQSICCFFFVIGIYLIITLTTFGFTLSSLLSVIFSLGFSSALLPYLDRLLSIYLNS